MNKKDRFWSKVDVRGPNECWPWLAAKNGAGYGTFSLNGFSTTAHRVAFQIVNGLVDLNKLDICHRCDNPSCVNPAHLWAGTRVQNLADMASKGRSNRPGGRKLTEDQVAVIKADTRKLREIAKDYGVSTVAIHYIRTGRNWSHVSPSRREAA